MINKLINTYLSEMKKGSALDLGSGNGSDIAFLRDKGFSVNGIEKNYGLDVESFINIDSTWDNITAFFILHFLKDGYTKKTVKWMQEHTTEGGVNMIQAFTTDATWPQREGTHFKPNELKEIYKDWDILHYEESPVPVKKGSNQMAAHLVARKP